MRSHNPKNRSCLTQFQSDHGRKLGQTCLPLTRKPTSSLSATDQTSGEIDLLQGTTSKGLIKKLKAHFARYGIPSHLVTDNGPQYTSAEFQTFTRDWGITHTTTSPHHSKANGKVESAVKSAKRMLRKTSKSGEDQYLALLNLRNVPSQGVETSPAQRLMGRRTRTLLSVTRSLLEPKGPPTKSETEQLELNQQRQAKYYNKSARDLQPLKQGDTVRMKPFQLGNKTWMKGKISQRLDERSYEVTAGGATYRRNRQHTVKTREPPEQQFNERSSGLTQTPIKPNQISLLQVCCTPVIHRATHSRSNRPPAASRGLSSKLRSPGPGPATLSRPQLN